MPTRSCCTLLMLCFVACARAQTPPRGQTGRDLHIARLTTAPMLDDDIDGTPPDDGKPATSTTKAWLAYDATNLYVIFVCQSSPGEMRARYTKRDDIFADDFVGVLL